MSNESEMTYAELRQWHEKLLERQDYHGKLAHPRARAVLSLLQRQEKLTRTELADYVTGFRTGMRDGWDSAVSVIAADIADESPHSDFSRHLAGTLPPAPQRMK